MFRPRLFHLKDEEQLHDYFAEHARYDDRTETYSCAGCIGDSPRSLFLKLKKAWEEDKKDFEENDLPDLAKKILLGKEYEIHPVHRRYFDASGD